MHRVVVIPLSAPDKAIFFKYLYDLQGDLIAVLVSSFAPAPVGRVFDADINSSTVGVDGETVGTCDFSPFKSATYRGKILSKLGVLGKFSGYFLKLLMHMVDGSDLDFLT